MAQLAPVPAADALVPPQNLEAEESILGAVMLSPGAITACRDILTADGREFYRESHARIWRAALRLADRGEPVDVITLTDDLAQRGELEDVGGRVNLHQIASTVPATANAAHYARIVLEHAQRRDLIRLGDKISSLGWNTPGEAADLVEQARSLAAQLQHVQAQTSQLESETWAQFERSATEHIPTIVNDLWPAGGLGFIAAPPKKGKTWVGLDLAIAVATGTPFLGHFDVTDPHPVVYVVLEGHRAAIRGRIGALARGHNLNPDLGSHDLDNLHIVYKPAGLNLADPAWIRTVLELVAKTGAKLLGVDVLRAAAVMKENSNDEFRDLVRALQPIQQTGCAIAMLHHFGKLTELSRDRTPGERMAGAGAMYGAFDVGVFITGSDEGARKLRIEFETRDVVSPDPLGLYLAGDTTGKAGGFVFTDAAAWTHHDDTPDEDGLAANATDVHAWLEQQPDRSATQGEIALAFDVDPRTITRRRPSYVRVGIEWEAAKGTRPVRYWLPQPLQTTQHVSGHEGGQDRVDTVHPNNVSTQETLHLQDKSTPDDLEWTRVDNDACPPTESADLQDKSRVDRVDSPTGRSTPLPGQHSPTPTDDINWDA